MNSVYKLENVEKIAIRLTVFGLKTNAILNWLNFLWSFLRIFHFFIALFWSQLKARDQIIQFSFSEIFDVTIEWLFWPHKCNICTWIGRKLLSKKDWMGEKGREPMRRSAINTSSDRKTRSKCHLMHCKYFANKSKNASEVFNESHHQIATMLINQKQLSRLNTYIIPWIPSSLQSNLCFVHKTTSPSI